MSMAHLLWKGELALPDSNGDEDKLKQEKAPCAGWHSCVLPGSYRLSDGRAPLWHHGSFAHPTSGEAKM